MFPRHALHFPSHVVLSAWGALPALSQHVQILLSSKAQFKCHISSSAAIFLPLKHIDCIAHVTFPTFHYCY